MKVEVEQYPLTGKWRWVLVAADGTRLVADVAHPEEAYTYLRPGSARSAGNAVMRRLYP